MRKQTLFVSGILMSSLIMWSCSAKKKSPNIVMIISDDQGYGDFSWTGNPYLETTNLDLLQQQSVTLTRYYTAPLSAPSRAALLTGRFQYRTGVWDTFRGRSNMENREKTIAEYLGEKGYLTGIFGKWHLGDNYPCRPDQQGFDSTYIFHNNDRFSPRFMNNNRLTLPLDRFLDDAVTDKAIEFITENRDKPFFAFVAFFMPHSHYNKQIGDEYIEPFIKYRELSDQQRQVYAMVANLDQNVGRIMQTLDNLGLNENTLVIFHSDNGGAGQRFETGLRGEKGTTYEGGICVPCLLKWKGTLDPLVIEEPVSVMDILPTLGEICGIDDFENPLDGMSLWPLLTGKKKRLPDRYIFQQQQPQQSGYDPQPYVNTCLIGRQYKLVFVNGEEEPELYDLVADRGENHNLADSLPEITSHYRQIQSRIFSDYTGRGFDQVETIIGNPLAGITKIGFSYIHPENGFLVSIDHEGKYLLEFDQIRTDLFGPNGLIGIRLGDKVFKEKVSGNENLKFEVTLPKGSYYMFPYNEDMIQTAGIYGGPEYGFKFLIINPVQ